MPIFEYKCPNCHHQMEILEKTMNPPAHKCPECAKVNLEKQISTFACGSSQPEPAAPPCRENCSSGHCPYSG